MIVDIMSPENSLCILHRAAMDQAVTEAEIDMSERRTLAFAQIIFDFDGVILDSVAIKMNAFAEVYADEDPQAVSAVVAYQEAHGGVGRAEKFRYFERSLFGRPGCDRDISDLCARYAGIIDESMRKARFIPGAEALLAYCSGAAPMHVVSGMPDPDLKSLLRQRALESYFDYVIGSPTSKLDAFRHILDETGIAAARTLAIGDSTTEFEAANALGIPFLAVVPCGEPNRFPRSAPVVRDLTTLPKLLATPNRLWTPG